MNGRRAICIGIIAGVLVILALAMVRVLSPNNRANLALVTPGAPVVEQNRFTIDKETTYFIGPVDKYGFINYAAALDEYLGKGVTSETNANVLLWKALGPTPGTYKRRPAEFFNLLGMDEPPLEGENFVDVKTYIREQLKFENAEHTKTFDGQFSATAQYPWAVADYPQVAKWLKVNEKALALVVAASKRPDYFCPVVDGSISELQDPVLMYGREFAKALASRALLRVNIGKNDEAWQDLLACHRLARLAGRNTPLMWRTVGIVIDQIAGTADVAFLERAGLTASQIRALERELRTIPPTPALANCVDVGERVQLLDDMMLISHHGRWYVHRFTDINGKPLPDAPIENIKWDPGLRIANQWNDKVVAVMREKDRPTRQQGLEQIWKESNERDAMHWTFDELNRAVLDMNKSPEARGRDCVEFLLGIELDRVRKIQIAADRATQQESNLYLSFALAAYQSDHKNYPKSLDSLVPKYLAKVPDDLFTGKPLIYRPSEDGYLLYSLGPDGKDDQGRGKDDEPKGDDIAIRMPVPKLVEK